jgi:hypothetical protein
VTKDPVSAMRPVISLQDFARAVAARKQALGITQADIVAARNSGARRTPAKRAQLARVQARARAAGLEPYPANF